MESREEMVQFVKDFVTKDYIVKAKVCNHINMSIPTMNRVIANSPKVALRSIRYAYLMIKDME